MRVNRHQFASRDNKSHSVTARQPLNWRAAHLAGIVPQQDVFPNLPFRHRHIATRTISASPQMPTLHFSIICKFGVPLYYYPPSPNKPPILCPYQPHRNESPPARIRIISPAPSLPNPAILIPPPASNSNSRSTTIPSKAPHPKKCPTGPNSPKTLDSIPCEDSTAKLAPLLPGPKQKRGRPRPRRLSNPQ